MTTPEDVIVPNNQPHTELEARMICSKCKTTLLGFNNDVMTRCNALHFYSHNIHDIRGRYECLGCESTDIADAVAIPADGAMKAVMETLLWETRPGMVFKHYKGPLYTIIGQAQMHDTREMHIIYVSHEKQTTNLRPAADFFQEVVWRGAVIPRFARVERK